MILSNTEIQSALKQGRLVIRPVPLPDFPDHTGRCPYATTAVDLRLGTEISYFKEGLPFDINLKNGAFADLFGPNSITQKITSEQPFVLRPNRLVLGKTMEHVELPLRQDQPSLAARVEGKSSYARCGLLVHFTAPTIHAGFAGTITLELINLGPCNISLYPETAICQLIVETVVGTPFRNDSQFQNQQRPGGNIRPQ
jgi:dCTP deaminase